MRKRHDYWLVLPLAFMLVAPGLSWSQDQEAEPDQDQAQEQVRDEDAAEPSDVVVSRITVARGVQDREPVDEGSSFPPDAGHLVCFTKIEGVHGEESIFHVWTHDGEEMARVELTVRGPAWRTWSKKTILPQYVGEWSISIERSSGEVLAATTFTIDPEPAEGI